MAAFASLLILPMCSFCGSPLHLVAKSCDGGHTISFSCHYAAITASGILGKN